MKTRLRSTSSRATSRLNRDGEFLYTLFVPARAHLAFPCFDQPDLKARYTLTLDVPAGWMAVSNGAAAASEAARSTDERAIRRNRTHLDVPVRVRCRQILRGDRTPERSRAQDVSSRDRCREGRKESRGGVRSARRRPRMARRLHRYSVIPSASSMSSRSRRFSSAAWNIREQSSTTAASLLLEESATQNQMLDRASVIAHETSHMWFGDLVTMRWFNDVWMKEVFANFMAAKIVNPSFPQVNHNLRFLLAHYPGAYQIDRTAGTNPIRQELANLNEAGQLYGPIIYQKAPIVMRQLEMIVGERAFRDGLREYLDTYAFGNATWLDLVRILDARTSENITAWSRAWVEERGRPEFTTAVRIDRGRISGLTLEMSDPLARGLVWPQRLRVALGYPGRVREVPDIRHRPHHPDSRCRGAAPAAFRAGERRRSGLRTVRPR